MVSELKKILNLTIILMVSLGVVLPLLVTGICRIIFPSNSTGSLVSMDGKVVGSKYIGQKFTSDKYFQGRPSQNNYDGMASGGSNLALTNPEFKKNVENNIDKFMKENPGVKRSDIPEDIVTASASGLDPEISVDAAYLQVARVAKANNMAEADVKKLVDNNTEAKLMGVFGENRVNVLELNLALAQKK